MSKKAPTTKESKYTPLNLEEFQKLKSVVDSITTHVPTNHTTYLWSSFNIIRGMSERQPCNCGSAANHWRRAVEGLKEWIKERE
jgi:hypothetical protein